MSNNLTGESHFRERVRVAAGNLFFLGLAMAGLGIAAIAFPVFSTLVAASLVGWVLLISGGLTLVGSYSIHGTGPFFGAMLLGLFSVAAGVFVVFNPLAGAVALTVLVGLIFVFQAAFELFFAFEMRPLKGWIGMLISGLASALLAIVIATGWPGISAVALGTLLGVNFLSTGIAYLVASRSV